MILLKIDIIIIWNIKSELLIIEAGQLHVQLYILWLYSCLIWFYIIFIVKMFKGTKHVYML